MIIDFSIKTNPANLQWLIFVGVSIKISKLD